jgi:hypothetical protein
MDTRQFWTLVVPAGFSGPQLWQHLLIVNAGPSEPPKSRDQTDSYADRVAPALGRVTGQDELGP